MTDKPLTLEKKWDNLWPAALAVVTSYEGVERSAQAPLDHERLLKRLYENCRRLKRVCDHISPDSPQLK